MNHPKGVWVKNPEDPASDSQKYKIRKMLERLKKDETWFEFMTGKEINKLTKGEANKYIEDLSKLENKKNLHV